MAGVAAGEEEDVVDVVSPSDYLDGGVVNVIAEASDAAGLSDAGAKVRCESFRRRCCCCCCRCGGRGGVPISAV